MKKCPFITFLIILLLVGAFTAYGSMKAFIFFTGKGTGQSHVEVMKQFVDSERCPPEYSYNKEIKRCTSQPLTTCESNYTLQNNLCLAQATFSCPGNGTYNPNTGQCEINVTTSSNSTTLTDFQVRTVINPSQIEQNCTISNLKVTDSNGSSLPNWIEPKSTDPDEIPFWVKVLSLPVGKKTFTVLEEVIQILDRHFQVLHVMEAVGLITGMPHTLPLVFIMAVKATC